MAGNGLRRCQRSTKKKKKKKTDKKKKNSKKNNNNNTYYYGAITTHHSCTTQEIYILTWQLCKEGLAMRTPNRYATSPSKVWIT